MKYVCWVVLLSWLCFMFGGDTQSMVGWDHEYAVIDSSILALLGGYRLPWFRVSARGLELYVCLCVCDYRLQIGRWSYSIGTAYIMWDNVQLSYLHLWIVRLAGVWIWLAKAGCHVARVCNYGYVFVWFVWSVLTHALMPNLCCYSYDITLFLFSFLHIILLLTSIYLSVYLINTTFGT